MVRSAVTSVPLVLLGLVLALLAIVDARLPGTDRNIPGVAHDGIAAGSLPRGALAAYETVGTGGDTDTDIGHRRWHCSLFLNDALAASLEALGDGSTINQRPEDDDDQEHCRDCGTLFFFFFFFPN